MAKKTKPAQTSNKSSRAVDKTEEYKNSQEKNPDLEKELESLKGELSGLANEDTEQDDEPETEPEKKATPAKKPKVKVEKPSAGSEADNLVTAKEIASDLGIEPKVLRRTLRKLKDQGKISERNGRWEWPAGSPDIKVIQTALGKKK